MHILLKKLSSLPYFRTSHIEVLLPDLKKDSRYKKVKRWIRKGEIVKLKRGFYVTQKYTERNLSDHTYYYYLANILRFPSYVSGVYVLQNHGILTDVTYPITSVTLKSSRKYSNQVGEFVYQTMSSKLYIGYNRLFYKNEPVYVASKVKALFDYLYLKYFKIKVTAAEVMVRERLNLESFTKTDIKEFKKYCKLANKRWLIKFSDQLDLSI